MKILTLCGTRPELIRLSIIISKLDNLVDHVLVYTNQNFTKNLSTIFFEELKIRTPNYTLDVHSESFGDFLGNAFIEFEKIFIKEKPDKVLILGDTNSGLLSLVVNRYKVPIFHMEAGNRCLSDKVPEETNRKLIDMLSTYNLSYTENSKQNLINEGYSKNHVFKTGNPLYEVLNYYSSYINKSFILSKLKVQPNKYVLVTAHRAENVDNKESLFNITDALNYIAKEYKIVFSVHPRTKQRLATYDCKLHENIILIEPLGLFDFVRLEKSARLIISDSGSATEESTIFNVPSLIIRESTERQELIECGSSILTGTNSSVIINAFNIVKNRKIIWKTPEDYLIPNVSDIVINILLGK